MKIKNFILFLTRGSYPIINNLSFSCHFIQEISRNVREIFYPQLGDTYGPFPWTDPKCMNITGRGGVCMSIPGWNGNCSASPWPGSAIWNIRASSAMMPNGSAFYEAFPSSPSTGGTGFPGPLFYEGIDDLDREEAFLMRDCFFPFKKEDALGRIGLRSPLIGQIWTLLFEG